jgi:hypothetical protein
MTRRGVRFGLTRAARLAVWASALWMWVAPAAAAADTGYYSSDDFARVRKIDAHMHVSGPAEGLIAQAARDNVRILTINVDYPDPAAIPLSRQLQDAALLRRRYPERVAFAAAFSVQNFSSPDWLTGAQHQLDAAVRDGAVGVKVWKNIGMVLRDPDGRYVMLDDPRFQPVFTRLERDHLVLLGHQAEPRNCWLPFDEMTVRSDRDYFREHPQYYMYRHPEVPSQDTILAARDRMLQAHPALRFDAVHLASLEWDIDKVAGFLDRFPQANVDLAARLVHLEYQAARTPAKVRAFLMRYQDRILYGTDERYGPDDNKPGKAAEIHKVWTEDWRFLTSADAMHSPDFDAAFQGLHLPRGAVDKIYRRNAEKMFPTAWHAAR